MKRALAVVEGDEAAKDLVREAGELAAGVGAELILVHVTTEEEFEAQREHLEKIPKQEANYNVGKAIDGAKRYASDIAREALEGIDVDYRVAGRLGNKARQILATAEEEDCDHIFLTGRKRSPTGKAVFGDTTQSVILDFDGAVTVVTV